MAYRKTEKVLAEIEGRRVLIVKTAIDIIKRRGLDALTSDSIAERSALSVGLIYKHFPDMNELRAHVFGQLLARDVEVLRDESTLAGGIRTLIRRLSANAMLTSALATQPAYRDGIRRELARLIKSAGGDNPSLLAGVVCGALIETAGSLRPRDEAQLVAALLRAVGVRSRVSA